MVLDWTVRELAEKAGVSHDTIVRIEGGERLKDSTIAKVREVFEAAGAQFTNGDAPGVRMTVNGITVDASAALPRDPLP
jgi:transcriptional regulator with XRE-family HTH domain